MEDDYTTKSHYLTFTYIFKRPPENVFFGYGRKGLISVAVLTSTCSLSQKIPMVHNGRHWEQHHAKQNPWVPCNFPWLPKKHLGPASRWNSLLKQKKRRVKSHWGRTNIRPFLRNLAIRGMEYSEMRVFTILSKHKHYFDSILIKGIVSKRVLHTCSTDAASCRNEYMTWKETWGEIVVLCVANIPQLWPNAHR